MNKSVIYILLSGIFLIDFSLSYPALALRPVGLEESPALRQSLEQRMVSGLEENDTVYSDPRSLMLDLMANGFSGLCAAKVEFLRGKDRLAGDIQQYIHMASALDNLIALQDKASVQNIESIQDFLPNLPRATSEWSDLDFIRWLLDASERPALSFVDLVYLYQLSNPDVSFAGRIALHAASALDHLIALQDEVFTASFSTVSALLPALPLDTSKWSDLDFIRWLLDASERPALSFVDLVYLYQLSNPDVSFAGRIASHAASALDHLIALQDEVFTASFSTVSALLPALPSDTFKWSDLDFIRWLLDASERPALSFVDLVYLYQLSNPDVSFVGRIALHAASALDHLVALQDEVFTASFSTVSALLPVLPSGTSKWSDLDFIRWLLDASERPALSFNNLVYLYQLSNPDVSFVGRIALHAASALDHLVALQDEVFTASFSTVSALLPVLPSGTSKWSDLDFIRWLLDASERPALSFNNLVYLYQLSNPDVSFAGRIASHAASALDHLIALQDEVFTASFSTVSALLPALPLDTFKWSDLDFIRWLLDASERPALSFVDLVSLYQLSNPDVSFAGRTALHAASKIDNLGRLKNPGARYAKLGINYITNPKTRPGINKIALAYREAANTPNMLGLCRQFFLVAFSRDLGLPRQIGVGSLAPATFVDNLPAMGNQYFRRWLAAWWVEDFLENDNAALFALPAGTAAQIRGYLGKAKDQFKPADHVDPKRRDEERTKTPAGVVLLEEAMAKFVEAAKSLPPGDKATVRLAQRELRQQIKYLKNTEPKWGTESISGLEEDRFFLDTTRWLEDYSLLVSA